MESCKQRNTLGKMNFWNSNFFYVFCFIFQNESLTHLKFSPCQKCSIKTQQMSKKQVSLFTNINQNRDIVCKFYDF